MLRDYQIDIRDRATDILQRLGMVYLAMEVRTGKTLTSLAIAEKYGAHSVLFCTTKKALEDIERQYESIPHTFDIDIVNYESLHKLENPDEYDLFILDEAHKLGAFPIMSQRTRQLKDMVGRRPVIFLSGTPTPESYSQIYHQFTISELSPFPEKNFYQWASNYVNVRKKYMYNREFNDYTHADAEAVMAAIQPYMISFTQAEAGFTEFVEEEVLTVPMTPATYKLAERLRIDKVVTNKDGKSVVADTAAKVMQKLHQIYSGTVIIDEPIREGAIFDTTKADFIRERFKGQKVAVFYKFVEEGLMLKGLLWHKIAETPQEFNYSDKDTWYVCQVQSGREGIDLSAADALVMLNIDFSAVSYWQSRARLQTKTREKAAKVFWIFSENGIEHKIYERVIEKKDYTLSHFKKDFGI